MHGNALLTHWYRNLCEIWDVSYHMNVCSLPVYRDGDDEKPSPWILRNVLCDFMHGAQQVPCTAYLS